MSDVDEAAVGMEQAFAELSVDAADALALFSDLLNSVPFSGKEADIRGLLSRWDNARAYIAQETVDARTA